MIKYLQNGSDIRGVALENDVYPVNFRIEDAKMIMYSFIQQLALSLNKQSEELVICIGNDSRLSADAIKSAMIDVALSYGVRVIDASLATTPAMFMSCLFKDYLADGSIMITASHLPFYYNGLKFFTKDGGFDNSDISSLLENTSSYCLGNKKGILVSKNILVDYTEHLIKIIKEKTNMEKPLATFKIIVDAGNGAAGYFVDVLKALGANTTGSQFLNPDGNFPNHIPNPEDKVAMQSLVDALKANQADLGIIFDTDGDRAGLVLDDGQAINQNALIALISSIVLEQYPHTSIVTDSITSDGLTKFINGLGGHHHRFKRGYKKVINEAKRMNDAKKDAQLAIETSGHGALKENYFLDDGAYLACLALIKMAHLKQENKKLQDLLNNLEQANYAFEERIKIDADDFKTAGHEILSKIELLFTNEIDFNIETPNYEGVKIRNHNNSWLLIRTSLHEPLIVINFEGHDHEEYLSFYNKIKELI